MDEQIDSKEREGYVAYFDILGYREMTNAGDFGQVIDALKEIKGKVRHVQRKLRGCKVFMFADSVIVFRFGKATESAKDVTADNNLVVYCRGIFEGMFRKGMPMRGAIAKGRFRFEREFFAGRPINEAYEYANSLEFAGCVLAPSAEDLYVGPFDMEDYDFAQLDVPVKAQGKQKLCVLKHSLPTDRDWIRKAFEMRGKTIGPSVLSKFNNTVEILAAAKKTK